MQANDSNLETQYPTAQYRQQFTAAMVVAGAKVEKKDKEETPRELFQRIKVAEEEEVKEIVLLFCQKID
jgi:predicted negative regulator of RcsB-dependent stress response